MRSCKLIENYVVSDSCISCGLCERVCSVNNIEIKDGKPVFFDRCISCYACIHHCPKAAIDIKGKTEKAWKICMSGI